MFKRIKEFFKSDKPYRKEIKRIVMDHPLNWVNKGQPFDDEFYRMVSEPVLTLIDSLKARPNRFKIYKLSHDEYVESRKDHADVYMWMRKGCLFYRFLDKVSGIKHTVVVSDGKLYRVDDLPFSLNHWEHTVLMKAFVVARKPSVDRIIERRRKRREEEREIAEQAERLQRYVYMENFK